ncbi:MAG: hypothetical protein IPJ65_22230 [Archangiaceae bacterium]|nr:hypothetical protein [Archangiaceae bacterium]
MVDFGSLALIASLVVVLVAFTPTLIDVLKRGNEADPLGREILEENRLRAEVLEREKTGRGA